MDSSTEEILLQKIEELVHDEDKIVTNSIVCENFDLSLTDAKHILEKYVSDANINPEKISVTYLICGKLKTGEYSIQIIDSVVLKERKKLYSSISNEVVYSVQKNNTIDFNAIALAQKSHTLKATALKGSIVGENCIEQLVKSKVLPPPPPQKIFEKQKPTSFFKPVVKTETNGEKQACQSNPPKNTETKAQSQKKIGGLAGFLSQCSNNSNNESKQNLKKTSSEEDVRDTKRPRLEISDNKQSEAKEEKKPEVSKGVKDITESNNSKKDEKSGKSENGESSKENKPSKKSSNKKKQDGKKRKRIIVESESEDDLFANDEEEEKMDVDIEEEKPVIAQAKEIIPKNKRRKAIEKVYTDDEGFVVTKTEYVLVSASEDEADVKDEKPKVKPVDKEEKKSPPQKVAAKGKKGKKLAANQTTLMSFFTKK